VNGSTGGFQPPFPAKSTDIALFFAIFCDKLRSCRERPEAWIYARRRSGHMATGNVCKQVIVEFDGTLMSHFSSVAQFNAFEALRVTSVHWTFNEFAI
jgi:hypothetical protein